MLIQSVVECRYKIKTRNGNLIAVAKSLLEETIQKRAAHDARLRAQFGIDAERITATNLYNCHGLSFGWKQGLIGLGCKETELPNWSKPNIDLANTEIEVLLHDNGYRNILTLANLKVDQIPHSTILKPGDIAIYKILRDKEEEITHSAIVVKYPYNLLETARATTQKGLSVLLLSKFGLAGEYIHSLHITESTKYGTFHIAA